ncbi:unnamed protein product [Parnassius apollo]|uniref:(apollo) hypothetical protein n=1 Tax=Parnassius apollo TaxID=110799 RepID=A0A8S3X5X7_PARAO|nr:unnamed protein product [Parnassius apollo]
MQRSPTNKRFDSDPDLSNIVARKRKYDHDISDSFKLFTDNILKKMDDWKTDFNNNLLQINDTINNLIKNDLAKLNEIVVEVKAEIDNMRKEYTEIKTDIVRLKIQQVATQKEINSLQQSVQFNADQQDEQAKKIETLAVDTKKTREIEMEIVKIKQQNMQLQSQLNSSEQRERLSNIEIVGVPECKSENLQDLILNIRKHIGVDIPPNDILQVNRVSPKIKLQGRPRVIIAKMRTRLLKDNIISRDRKARITSRDIDVTGESRPIYINEHLTSFNKQLLKKCKELAKIKQHQFVWVKNGLIFVRKNDNSPALKIISEEDLKKLSVSK